MYFSKTVITSKGTFQIYCDAKGITEIRLPGTHSTTGAGNETKSKKAPAFLEKAAQQIREYIAGERTDFDLPMSLRGTPFQLQVWDIIRRIPYGQTMSYGEIARQLGGTEKARAVGGAAHVNPLSLIIPCHRVIGSNGSLTGYAGGITLKEQLLEMERNTTPP